jgi:hypothetical protein
LSRLGFTSLHELGDPAAAWPANGASCAALAACSGQWKENKAMEMHSRQSLYEIHGISIERRRRRSRLIARLLIARIVAFLSKVLRAIETKLATR